MWQKSYDSFLSGNRIAPINPIFRPNWGKYNILTIICDQFWAIAYQWDKILPADKQKYFKADWMKSHILEGHGPLCSLYQAHKDGDKGGFKDRRF